MRSHERTYVYIDGANLKRGLQSLGWEIDYARFRIWLKEKYGAEKAYIFLGFIPKNEDMYEGLRLAGFELIFKEVSRINGVIKGNCDAELVFQIMVDWCPGKFNKAVIVSSDGDYACIANFLAIRNKLAMIISPHLKCSYLLRKASFPIVDLSLYKDKLMIKDIEVSP